MSTTEEVLSYVGEVISDVDIEVEKAIVFGSTARGERHEDSDTDVLIISSDYEEDVIYKRAPRFLRVWDYDNYGSVDFLCLTPGEFDEKKSEEGSVYYEADEEGIRLYPDY